MGSDTFAGNTHEWEPRSGLSRRTEIPPAVTTFNWVNLWEIATSPQLSKITVRFPMYQYNAKDQISEGESQASERPMAMCLLGGPRLGNTMELQSSYKYHWLSSS